MNYYRAEGSRDKDELSTGLRAQKSFEKLNGIESTGIGNILAKIETLNTNLCTGKRQAMKTEWPN